MNQQLEPTHHVATSGAGVAGPPVASRRPAPGRGGLVVAALVGVLVAVLVVGAVVVAVRVGALRLPVAPAATTPATPVVDPAAAGRSRLLATYGELSSATQSFSDELAAHGGDTRAQQRDCAVHREAVLRFRTAVGDTAFAPADRQRVTAELLPVADRMVVDLTTMSTTTSRATLATTATEFDRDGVALDGVVRSVVGG